MAPRATFRGGVSLRLVDKGITTFSRYSSEGNMKITLPKNKSGRYRLGQRSKKFMRTGRLVCKVTACVVAIAGVLLIILNILTSLQATYAFFNTARTIQGTAEISHEKTDPCGTMNSDGSCESTTTCSTTVYFTPFDHKTRFKTIDTQCDALAEGAKVEVLYASHDPNIAKTVRQASTDITDGISVIITRSIFVFVILVLIVVFIARR
jgi:hypothetical protein